MMKLVLLLGIVSFSSVSMADQCAYVTKAQAKAALKMVLETTTLQTLCEPCGETAAKKVTYKDVGVRDVKYQGYWELQVDGAGLDLAYTYVNGLNLAQLVGCPATRVSPSIK